MEDSKFFSFVELSDENKLNAIKNGFKLGLNPNIDEYKIYWKLRDAWNKYYESKDFGDLKKYRVVLGKIKKQIEKSRISNNHPVSEDIMIEYLKTDNYLFSEEGIIYTNPKK